MTKNYKYIVSIFLVLMVICTTNLTDYKAQSVTMEKTNFKDTIVLYNTHTEERYSYGKNISEATNKLKEKILKAGFNCSYLKSQPNTPRNKAFETSRGLIKKNISKYDQKILLDVHLKNLGVKKGQQDEIRIIVGKRNSGFKQNLNFANLLLKELQKNDSIKSTIYIDKNLTQNQDLSPRALLIELGNSNSSEKDIQNYIDALSVSLENLNTDKE